MLPITSSASASNPIARNLNTLAPPTLFFEEDSTTSSGPIPRTIFSGNDEKITIFRQDLATPSFASLLLAEDDAAAILPTVSSFQDDTTTATAVPGTIFFEEDTTSVPTIKSFLDDTTTSTTSTTMSATTISFASQLGEIIGDGVQINMNEGDTSMTEGETIIFNDGGTHTISSSDSGMANYEISQSTTLSLQDSDTYITGSSSPTISMDGNSQLILAGSDISITGAQGTSENVNGGVAIQLMGGSTVYIESMSVDTMNSVSITGGEAYGEGNAGGDALHLDGEETLGTIVSGSFRGGNAALGTNGNSLRISNMAELSILGGDFIGNVLVESGGQVTVSHGKFRDEVIVVGEGSTAVFRNGCFTLVPSDEDEEVVYVTGKFASEGDGLTLEPNLGIAVSQINGGVVGVVNDRDCSSIVPVSNFEDDDSSSLFSPTVFGDGKAHNLTSNDSGVGVYHVVNETKLSIEESFISVTAPEGIGESNPTFLIDAKSQLFISGRIISIMGSSGNAETTHGGPAIQIKGGSNGYLENFPPDDDSGGPITITGGSAFGEGNVGGDALQFDGSDTTGTIVSGNFQGGAANMGTRGNSLHVANSAQVTIRGGNFFGNVYIESFANVDIFGGNFEPSSSEIIVSGEGSSAVFRNGCFNLTNSEDDEEVIYVTGYFVTVHGELGPYQQFTAIAFDEGLVGKIDHQDCEKLLYPGKTFVPTPSPSFNPISYNDNVIVYNDGQSHSLSREDSGVALYRVLNSSKLKIEDDFTTVRAPDEVGETEPTLMIDDNSQIFMAGSGILVTGSSASGSKNGGHAIKVTHGSQGYFENFGEDNNEIRGGDASGSGVGGDAIHFDGEGTGGFVISGNFRGGEGFNSTIGHSLVASNLAEVTLSGGEFYGNVKSEYTTLSISGGVFRAETTEVISFGQGSFVKFYGCFQLSQSSFNEEIVFVIGVFTKTSGPGPFQNITSRQVSGGQVVVVSDPNCDDVTFYTLSPTPSPSTQSSLYYSAQNTSAFFNITASPSLAPSTVNSSSSFGLTSSPTESTTVQSPSDSVKSPAPPSESGCSMVSLSTFPTVICISLLFLLQIQL